MIQTIINTPKVLASNDAAITFDGVNDISRCTLCSNGGWLSYQNGSPLFKVFGNNYTGRYEVSFGFAISSATPGTVAVGLYEDGVLIPDSVRPVTVAAANDQMSVSLNRIMRVCSKGMTTLSVQSVPSVVALPGQTAPVETQIPIIVNGSFEISRKRN